MGIRWKRSVTCLLCLVVAFVLSACSLGDALRVIAEREQQQGGEEAQPAGEATPAPTPTPPPLVTFDTSLHDSGIAAYFADVEPPSREEEQLRLYLPASPFYLPQFTSDVTATLELREAEMAEAAVFISDRLVTLTIKLNTVKFVSEYIIAGEKADEGESFAALERAEAYLTACDEALAGTLADHDALSAYASRAESPYAAASARYADMLLMASAAFQFADVAAAAYAMGELLLEHASPTENEIAAMTSALEALEEETPRLQDMLAHALAMGELLAELEGFHRQAAIELCARNIAGYGEAASLLDAMEPGGGIAQGDIDLLRELYAAQNDLDAALLQALLAEDAAARAQDALSPLPGYYGVASRGEAALTPVYLQGFVSGLLSTSVTDLAVKYKDHPIAKSLKETASDMLLGAGLAVEAPLMLLDVIADTSVGTYAYLSGQYTKAQYKDSLQDTFKNLRESWENGRSRLDAVTQFDNYVLDPLEALTKIGSPSPYLSGLSDSVGELRTVLAVLNAHTSDEDRLAALRDLTIGKLTDFLFDSIKYQDAIDKLRENDILDAGFQTLDNYLTMQKMIEGFEQLMDWWERMKGPTVTAGTPAQGGAGTGQAGAGQGGTGTGAGQTATAQDPIPPIETKPEVPPPIRVRSRNRMPRDMFDIEPGDRSLTYERICTEWSGTMTLTQVDIPDEAAFLEYYGDDGPCVAEGMMQAMRSSIGLSTEMAVVVSPYKYGKVHSEQMAIPGVEVIEGNMRWRFRLITLDFICSNLAYSPGMLKMSYESEKKWVYLVFAPEIRDGRLYAQGKYILDEGVARYHADFVITAALPPAQVPPTATPTLVPPLKTDTDPPGPDEPVTPTPTPPVIADPPPVVVDPILPTPTDVPGPFQIPMQGEYAGSMTAARILYEPEGMPFLMAGDPELPLSEAPAYGQDDPAAALERILGMSFGVRLTVGEDRYALSHDAIGSSLPAPGGGDGDQAIPFIGAFAGEYGPLGARPSGSRPVSFTIDDIYTAYYTELTPRFKNGAYRFSGTITVVDRQSGCAIEFDVTLTKANPSERSG